MYAPYQDMSLTGSSAGVTQNDLPAISTASGIKYFTMAFIDDAGSCTPDWGGVGTVSSDSTFTGYISTLRSDGGDVIISSGGYSADNTSADGGGPTYDLVWGGGCSTAAKVQSAYQAILNKYSASSSKPVALDFDIEGDALSNPGNSITIRNQGIAALQKANPGLKVSYTIPVNETGLDSSGTSLL